jgi:hypothetical protein
MVAIHNYSNKNNNNQQYVFYFNYFLELDHLTTLTNNYFNLTDI